MATMGNILFVENVSTYVKMLDKWLGGSVVQEHKNDDGELTFAMYVYDGVMIGIIKPSEATTNTSVKVNGSTNNILLFLDSKEKTDALYKKGIEAGLTGTREPAHRDPEDTSSPYSGSFQDHEKQYWTVGLIPKV